MKNMGEEVGRKKGESGKSLFVRDPSGYVLTSEEVKIEMEKYNTGGISFLCRTCRSMVGTNNYREFRRRRDQMRRVPFHVTEDKKIVLQDANARSEKWEDMSLEEKEEEVRRLEEEVERMRPQWEKETERFEKLTLVTCPKCGNQYGRICLEKCPDCGEPNPEFEKIWKNGPPLRGL